jgi:fimbrial chaperone protein
MRRLLLTGALLGALSLDPWSASATSLEVKPIMIEAPAGVAASTLSLRNSGSEVLHAQLRVFRWNHETGKDELVPTREVVASPPFAKIAPGGDLLVRVVRTSKAPIAAEESYRLLIDELPPPGTSTGINLLVRYSMPVFFGTPVTGAPKVRWTVTPKGKEVVITATNEGSRRARISGLTLVGGNAPIASLGDGLNGYVLTGQTKQWTVPASKALPAGGLLVTAETDRGPLRAPATVGAR